MSYKKDIWSEIEQDINLKLKNYSLIKKDVVGLKSLDLDAMKDWQTDVYETNLGKVVLYTREDHQGIIIVYTLENRIQNLYFGSNNELDLVKLVGEFFVKTILGWF
ncbi:MAG: hypothetical protein OdinLCB4_001615 [Candidatus Odinarchaeum yellowstonii]|uniref:Uncharacterized protein n=1 Tax=Odinarchaeota yellowstonii (strain LCB_4) TaxID=1841599 RepID=A0AAF0D2Y4_ODILC|nr:MAG: hypothetical protein OdinLCB4_001615 [Candidatus Odinarchaeum yellowstonii]